MCVDNIKGTKMELNKEEKEQIEFITDICKELNWEPTIKLRDGIEKTYQWIYDRMSTV